MTSKRTGHSGTPLLSLRTKPLPPHPDPTAQRFGKTRRPFGDPVAIAKNTPYFIPPPPTNLVNLNMPMSAILPDEASVSETAGKLVFHSVGDTGGIHGDDVEIAISNAMEAQIDTTKTDGSQPAFLYLLGDVIYYNGVSTLYNAQFYEPYKYYPRAIFAIPGNHDGDIRTRANDPVDHEPSLTGFMQNFCDTAPHNIYQYRTTMTQPYVYWTFDTPLATIIGLYSNVEGSLDARSTNEQQTWFEQQMKNASPDKALIVTVHHPPYSLDASHGGTPDIGIAIDRAIQAASGRAPDAVLSGHVHNYQRFERTLGGKKIPYIVAGAGGYADTATLLHKLQSGTTNLKLPFQTTLPDVKLMSFNESEPGFLRVTVDSTTLTFEYYTVPFGGAAVSRFDSIQVKWKS
ncbi:MAG TPA: metallophosphoesterase [Verrucomicrobiae bacterium]|nr:metallophosphoesterase [Verrucomicrobiae bacterium]